MGDKYHIELYIQRNVHGNNSLDIGDSFIQKLAIS